MRNAEFTLSFYPQTFIDDIKQFTISPVYSLHDSDDQLDVCNDLFLDCVERHAPLKRIKVSRPTTPWIKHVKSAQMQKQFIELRTRPMVLLLRVHLDCVVII